jgi:uncharacterized membrane protein
MLLPIPIVCFIGALVADLRYVRSDGNLIYLDFSAWLIAAGLLLGAVAGILLLIELFRGPRRSGWLHFLLLLAAWAIELINSFVHARDGWTAVAGTGLILSIAGAAVILVSGWVWQSLRYRVEGDAL